MKLRIDFPRLSPEDYQTYVLYSPTDVPVQTGTVHSDLIEIDYEPLFVSDDEVPAMAADGYWMYIVQCSPAGCHTGAMKIKDLTPYEKTESKKTERQ